MCVCVRAHSLAQIAKGISNPREPVSKPLLATYSRIKRMRSFFFHSPRYPSIDRSISFARARAEGRKHTATLLASDLLGLYPSRVRSLRSPRPVTENRNNLTIFIAARTKFFSMQLRIAFVFQVFRLVRAFIVGRQPPDPIECIGVKHIANGK